MAPFYPERLILTDAAYATLTLAAKTPILFNIDGSSGRLSRGWSIAREKSRRLLTLLPFRFSVGSEGLLIIPASFYSCSSLPVAMVLSLLVKWGALTSFFLDHGFCGAAGTGLIFILGRRSSPHPSGNDGCAAVARGGVVSFHLLLRAWAMVQAYVTCVVSRGDCWHLAVAMAEGQCL